jgi:hypothetical protein
VAHVSPITSTTVAPVNAAEVMCCSVSGALGIPDEA